MTLPIVRGLLVHDLGCDGGGGHACGFSHREPAKTAGTRGRCTTCSSWEVRGGSSRDRVDAAGATGADEYRNSKKSERDEARSGGACASCSSLEVSETRWAPGGCFDAGRPSCACDSRHGAGRAWPDLDVRTSLRGADGCRPVFSVVATPSRSVCRAQFGTGGAANRSGSARRHRDIEARQRGYLSPTPDPPSIRPGL